MARNPIVDIFRVKELRERILFTVGMLLIFRIGAVIPVPGVDVNAVAAQWSGPAGGGQSVVEYLDFFTGGAFSEVSVFMLGIMPYISMSIIMQLLLLVFPALKRISEEDGGRKKIQKYTRYGTLVICVVQSFALLNTVNPSALRIDTVPFFFLATLTLSAGTMFLMWIGEQINQRGIGNGISLLIFAGIVARLPQGVWALIQAVQNDQANPVLVILVLGLFVGVVALVIYEQRGQRKIPVHYAKRVVGRRVMQAPNTYIPFKINPSGVIPVIFAMSVLTFPLSLLQGLAQDVGWIRGLLTALAPGRPWYLITYTLLIVFFGYFYTQVTLNPMEISRRIREAGGSIPGIRSENMEEYLTRILNRIILPGSLFLAFIAVTPTIVQSAFGFPAEVAYLMGGTSLLIMVGVDLDLMSQIEGQMRMHHQEGLTKRTRIKSRNL